MKVKKLIGIVLMFILMLAVFVACGSNESGGSKDDKIELNISWWGTNTHHDLYLEVIELFEAKHENVEIIAEYSGFSGYWEKLATKAAAGNLPDLVQMDFNRINEFASKNLLKDLQPFVDEDILNLEGANEDILKGGEIEDILYAVPLGVNTRSLILEPDLFEKAGVDLLEPGHTWDDYIAKARELKEGLDDDNYVMPLEKIGEFMHYLSQYNLSLFNEENTGVGFEDQVLVDFLEMWKPLREEGVTPPAELLASVIGQEDKLIIKEIAPIDSALNSQIAFLDDLTGKSLELMTLPTSPDAPNGRNAQHLKPSVLFSITEDATDEKAKLAAEFIEFFTKSEEANEVLLGLRGNPIFPEVEEFLAPIIPETEKKAFDFVKLVEEEYSSPIYDPPPQGWAEIRDLHERLVEDWRYDNISSEEFASEFNKGVTKILKD